MLNKPKKTQFFSSSPKLSHTWEGMGGGGLPCQNSIQFQVLGMEQPSVQELPAPVSARGPGAGRRAHQFRQPYNIV